MERSPQAHDPFGGGRAAARTLLASLAFRMRHAWRDAPPGFATFRAAAGARTPAEITEHVTDLLRFAGTALGGAARGDAAPRSTDGSPLAAFEAAARWLDGRLLDGVPADAELAPDAMLRGPLADALSHAGQLTLLRRLAGAPVEKVAYWRVPMPAPGEANG
jgi:hypothetical protein